MTEMLARIIRGDFLLVFFVRVPCQREHRPIGWQETAHTCNAIRSDVHEVRVEHPTCGAVDP